MRAIPQKIGTGLSNFAVFAVFSITILMPIILVEEWVKFHAKGESPLLFGKNPRCLKWLLGCVEMDTANLPLEAKIAIWLSDWGFLLWVGIPIVLAIAIPTIFIVAERISQRRQRQPTGSTRSGYSHTAKLAGGHWLLASAVVLLPALVVAIIRPEWIIAHGILTSEQYRAIGIATAWAIGFGLVWAIIATVARRLRS
jgi:hypothetical protein